MEQGEFIQTPRGRANRLGHRRRRRIRLSIDQSRLAKKGSTSGADATLFDREMRAQLEAQGRAALRGPTVLRIRFESDGGRPVPALHSLVKNYQDRLQDPGNAAARRVVRDDSQVDVLIAELRRAAHTGVRAVAHPVRDLLDDLETAAAIDIDIDNDPPDPFRLDSAQSRAEFYRDLALREADPARRAGLELGEKLARAELQTGLLQGGEQIFSCALNCLDSSFPFQPFRALLDNNPLLTDMPGVPTSPGESAHFAAEVRQRMARMASQHHWMVPLHIPVSLVIVYVPPSACGSRDLDNVARVLTKEFNAIFKPSLLRYTKDELTYLSSAKHLPDADKIFRPDLSFLSRAPTSIARYQAIRLPRRPSDPREGYLGVTVGPAVVPDLLAQLDARLDKWTDDLDSDW